jgi:hypothetical protein
MPRRRIVAAAPKPPGWRRRGPVTAASRAPDVSALLTPPCPRSAGVFAGRPRSPRPSRRLRSECAPRGVGREIAEPARCGRPAPPPGEGAPARPPRGGPQRDSRLRSRTRPGIPPSGERSGPGARDGAEPSCGLGSAPPPGEGPACAASAGRRSAHRVHPRNPVTSRTSPFRGGRMRGALERRLPTTRRGDHPPWRCFRSTSRSSPC